MRTAFWLMILFATPCSSRALADGQTAAQVRQANEAMESRRYKDAVALFSQANAAEPHPTNVYNIARAYHLSARYSEALAVYESFLAQYPKESLVPVVRGYIASIKDILRKKDPPLYQRPWFWGVLGAVVAGGGLAIGLGVRYGQPADRNPPLGSGSVSFGP